MSETAGTEAAEAPSEETTQQEPFDAERAQAKIAKANREAQNLRQRLKELEPLAQRAKELEDANKPEMQKLVEQINTLQAERDSASLTALRLEVMLEKGLSKDDLEFIHGATAEELAASADKFLERVGARQQEESSSAGPARRPVEQLRPGATPANLPLNGDPLERALKQKLGIT